MSGLPQVRRPGLRLTGSGAEIAVRAPEAERVELCLFGEDDSELARHDLPQIEAGLFAGDVAGLSEGDCYGLRAHGPWAPEQGHRFDPSKLLVDPLATRLDRPFTYDPRLGEYGFDTAALVPKAIAERPLPAMAPAAPIFQPGGLVYEVPVRAFTLRHPDIPEAIRGTLKALCHPAILAHLKALHVGAIELMPVAAWIDERHLPALGLSNAWGYNPVAMLALDPRIAPGGIADLREVIRTMHANGIGVIVDVVYNHTGESDVEGATLSLRGLGHRTYFAHDREDPGLLINDTGCGNTLACYRAEVQELVLAAMRHLVGQSGVDGFRFDLAPVLGRTPDGFDPQAEMLRRIAQDPMLADRVLIAEPWDVGPGGYQLGRFPPNWLEWNDRARDDIRRFWRGDGGMAGALATRLAGSSDIFDADGADRTRSVNFVAAHDGFPLGDLVTYAEKHNEANGEGNRDGHNENFSWNCGLEGPSDDPEIRARREADARALIATLFASRGTLLMTAGDEFGHTQGGNNNAYAQDNAITWRDWRSMNEERFAYSCAWAKLRAETPLLREQSFLVPADGSQDSRQCAWLRLDGTPLEGETWNDPDLAGLLMVLGAPGGRLAVAFNRSHRDQPLALPATRSRWLPAGPGDPAPTGLPARSVMAFREAAE